jgi:hydrogenase maturation protease
MNFDGVEKIAAAILYEGYILYPYRPTAIKNRQRWNFGTLYPRVYAEAQRPQEPYCLVAECLVTADANASLDLRISFLQLVPQHQSVSAAHAEEVQTLSDLSLAWDEAVERTSEFSDLRLNNLIASPLSRTLQIDRTGLPEGRSGNSALNLQLELTVGAETLQDGACKLHIEVQNTSPLPSGAEAKRDEALPLSFVSAHLLLGITGGDFVSLLDPGDIYRESAAACRNAGVFPVLAGVEPERSMMLCSPIILYDYPQVAPESEGDFFDGTEMDEMLTLRVLTLTDAEKQEMRNGDPRARKILERTETLTAESMLKAHGVIRGLREIRRDVS